MYVNNPFVAFFFPFAAGILSAYFLHLSVPLIVIITFLLIIIFLEFRFFRYHSVYFGLFAYTFLFLFGIYIFDFHKYIPPEINTNQKYLYQAVVCEPVVKKEKSFKTILKIKGVKDSTGWKSMDTKAVVYFKKDSSFNLSYGDLIVFSSQLDEIRNNGNPYEFDYKSFMNNQGVFIAGFVDKGNYMLLAHNKASEIKAFALKVRQNLMNIYKKFDINGQQFAVLSALTLGYRDAVDSDTRQMFADTGAMHILAVSGLHVGIIYLILINLLSFMDKKRSLLIFKSIIIIVSLWLFALIAGMSASVTRSALMFSLFVIGKLLRRNSSIYNTILASAFMILLFEPYSILSVGFQLSYAAVLAIVFFQPYIYDLLFFKSYLADKTWALVSVSIAAQLGTMPIGLYYFHQFPNYFFLTNILVIPLASLILYTAVLLFAVSFIPVLNAAIAFILKILLKILLGGISLIDSLPFATTKNIFITGGQTILLFAIIISFTMIFIYKKRSFVYSFLLSLILFLTLDINLNINNLKNNNLIVFNSRGNLLMHFAADKNYIISDDKLLSDKKNLKYTIEPYLLALRKNSSAKKFINIDSMQNMDTANNLLLAKNNFMQIGNLKLLILRSDDLTSYATKKKIKIDFLILSDNVYVSIKKLIKYLDFKKIIFDSSNKQYRIAKWAKECKELNIPYFDISSQGAWTVNYVTGKEE